jgi:alpha-ketoglutarate-dependent taurine dioxygenase
MAAALRVAEGDPFDPDDDRAWAAWRARKLADAPPTPADLLVELRDPAALSPTERAAILQRCARWNMAVYAGPATVPADDDPDAQRRVSGLARQLGRQLGLERLDHNWLADEDGISSLRVSADATPRGEYIPYTDQPIRWHTDGYYNPPARRIRALLLHCVQRAETGGENRLMDHEIAYLLLRDADPAHVRALSAGDAMTIPARDGERPGDTAGADGAARPAQAGPVFSRPAGGGPLHMRYTARTRSIVWKDDAATRAAEAALRGILAAGGPHVLQLRLEPGMGLVCNNVLHDRSGFADSAQRRRWVLRARYYDRIGERTGELPA